MASNDNDGCANCGVVVLFVIVFCIISLIDSCGKSPTIERGVVRAHTFTPAYTTNSTVMVGKIPMNRVEQHPDRWELAVEVDGVATFRSEVTRELYERLKDGDPVFANHAVGRIFDHGFSDIAPVKTFY